MNARKVFYILIGLLVAVGLGTLVSVKETNTLLERQSGTLTDLKATSKATDDQQVQLEKDKKDIVTYQQLNEIAKSVVPQDKDQAEAVREIVNLASGSGIPQLSSIAFPPSTLGTASSKNGLTQLSPVEGIPGVYNLQITVTQDAATPVPYNSFISFLGKLEQNRRTAQVSSITVQPDQNNATMVSFTLTVDEFIKP